jgi:hypothetical protein
MRNGPGGANGIGYGHYRGKTARGQLAKDLPGQPGLAAK